MTPPLRTLALAGGALLALTLGGMAAHWLGPLDANAEARKAIFVALGCLAAVSYFIAAATVQHPLPARRALWLVLGVAIGLRAITLAAPPFLSTDLYRYIWDGRVQTHGINPYRYLPTDPALESLRETRAYPNITRANYACTIYPPAAQALFVAIAGISQTPLAIKAAMVAFEILAVAVMLRLLALAGMAPARVAIYAWNPVTVWEFAGNGHIDAACIGMIALACLAAVRRRPALAGAALGVAALLKFLPLAVVPALWRRPDWRMPAALLLTIAALYACYAGVGWRVFGFLPGYASEEGLHGSGIYWLEALGHVVTLPAYAGPLWIACAAAALAALAGWIGLRRRRPASVGGEIVWTASGIAVLATATTLAITPHYTWYFAWLAWPCCLVPYPSVIFLSVAAIVMYHDPFHDRALQFSLIYLPFLVLAGRDLWRRRATAPVHNVLARSS